MATCLQKETDYFKLGLLLLRIAPRAVRVKFDKEFHPNQLREAMRGASKKLKTLADNNKMHKEQFDLLFPRNGSSMFNSFLFTNLSTISNMNVLFTAFIT